MRPHSIRTLAVLSNLLSTAVKPCPAMVKIVPFVLSLVVIRSKITQRMIFRV